jgi:nucleoid-associated protein YgaU
MKTNQTLKLALTLLTSGVLLYGCGTKQVTQSEVPQEPNAGTATNASLIKKSHVESYSVRKHDTLWAIAGKSSTYGDPFEWPLIFKANRDKIEDPDLIYPAQVFKIETQLPAAELTEAEKLAAETPKYKPHDKPRAKLALSYF